MSACSCISVDIGDEADFHTSSVQKSRAVRVCEECCGAINPGDEYERVFYVWDGMKETYRTCKTCLEIRNTFMCSWHYSMVWEDLQEAFVYQDGIPWSDIGSLSKEARDIMCDWIETEIWGDDGGEE